MRETVTSKSCPNITPGVHPRKSKQSNANAVAAVCLNALTAPPRYGTCTCRPARMFVRMNSSERLFEAIRSGDTAAVQRLLADEPQLVHARDRRGSTPLVLAAYLDRLACCRLLLAAGARPDAKDAAGSTPLMGASFRGHAAVVAYLIEQGAGVNVAGPDGMTALRFAEMGGHAELIELLKTKGG